MENFDKHIELLIASCQSTIEQMTHIRVNSIETRKELKDNSTLPFAHIIAYKDYDDEIDGEFVLGFQNVNDALKLASSISERLGAGKFNEINEDSTDLLNEFLNIVVGRTISDWDSIGLKVQFETPVFKKDYKSKGIEKLTGYLIEMDIISNTVDLEEKKPTDKILLRVNFLEKRVNKIEGKKILLAEDSKFMRTIIAKVLTENGATVIEAADGKEAVILHKNHRPDLSLMDINMPVLNGLDAIAQIKKLQPDSKFIILSSSSRKDEILCAKNLNVSSYLIKPVEADQLIKRISTVL